jgi:hypothetical protein
MTPGGQGFVRLPTGFFHIKADSRPGNTRSARLLHVKRLLVRIPCVEFGSFVALRQQELKGRRCADGLPSPGRRPLFAILAVATGRLRPAIAECWSWAAFDKSWRRQTTQSGRSSRQRFNDSYLTWSSRPRNVAPHGQQLGQSRRWPLRRWMAAVVRTADTLKGYGALSLSSAAHY